MIIHQYPDTEFPQGLPLPQLIELASPMPPFLSELREKIRNDQKWQTRRPVSPQPANDVARSNFVDDAWHDLGGSRYVHLKYKKAIRYLREPLIKGEDGLAYYRDDKSIVVDRDGQYIKWRWKKDILTQIFMPRDAARWFFEWKVVGIQKIDDISIEDIRAEGVRHTVNYGPILWEEFKHLWDVINARRGFAFDDNPYVWVYEFHKYKRGL